VPKPKPSTISRDPYASDPYAFLGTPAKPSEEKPPAEAEPRAEAKPPARPEPARKVVTEKITTPFPADLIERARNAVYWEPDLTLTSLIVEAVADALDRREQERGEPYPPRNRKLRSGRPVGTGKSKEHG
jgi:hypothetical protein